MKSKKITTRELIERAKKIYYAGMCECGERKFDISCGDNLVYKPIHESTIWQVRPELLNEIKYYDGYGSVSE